MFAEAAEAATLVELGIPVAAAGTAAVGAVVTEAAAGPLEAQ